MSLTSPVSAGSFTLVLTNRQSPYLSYTARFMASGLQQGHRVYTAMHNNISVDALRTNLAEFWPESLEQLLEKRKLSLIYAPDFFLPDRQVVKDAAIRNMQDLLARSEEPVHLVADFGWARDYALLPQLIEAFQSLYQHFAGKVNLLSLCYAEDLTLEAVRDIISCHDVIAFQNGVLFAEFTQEELASNDKLVSMLYHALIDTSQLVKMGHDTAFLNRLSRDISHTRSFDSLIQEAVFHVVQYTRADFGFIALSLNTSVESSEVACYGIDPRDVRAFVEAATSGWVDALWPVEPRLLRRGDPSLALLQAPVESVAVVPLYSGRVFQGFVGLGSGRRSFASSLSLAFLSSLGESVGEVCAARVQQSAALAQVSQAERLHALGALTSGVAHELNNLLTVILSNVQLASLLGEGRLSAERAQFITAAAKDAAAVVRRIQSFYRDAGHDQPREMVSVRDVVEDALGFSRAKWQVEAQARQIRTTIKVDNRSSGHVLGDPTGLRQVIVNLIINAFEAGRPNGPPVIHISSWDADGKAYVSVFNTGPRIAKDDMERIFDPFFTTKAAKGSGMGLSVSKGIVERHGGQVAVENDEERHGVIFTISLPLAVIHEEDAPKEDDGLVMLESGILAGKRLLIVDDNPYISSATSELFRIAGAITETAANVPDAMAMFAEKPFDGVITDHVLPEITGLELAQWIKQRWPRTKVALVTGWTEAGELDCSSVDLLLRKPLMKADLRVLVHLFR